MINIGMNPDIVKFGPLTLSWHGFFSVVAGVVAVWLGNRLAPRMGVDKNHLMEVLLPAVIGGLIVSRAVHVIDYWDFYSTRPLSILAFHEGGLTIWGAILGGMVTAALYALFKGYETARILDLGAVGLILGQAIGRIGDIINGEHTSVPTDLPWGVVYTHPGSPSYGLAPQHPAVAYEMLMDLAIFGLLWKLKERVRPPGSLFLLYLSIYAFGRFFLSFLREDSNFVGLGLNQPQWLSLLVLVVTVPWLVSRIGKGKREYDDAIEEEAESGEKKEG